MDSMVDTINAMVSMVERKITRSRVQLTRTRWADRPLLVVVLFVRKSALCHCDQKIFMDPLPIVIDSWLFYYLLFRTE